MGGAGSAPRGLVERRAALGGGQVGGAGRGQRGIGAVRVEGGLHGHGATRAPHTVG